MAFICVVRMYFLESNIIRYVSLIKEKVFHRRTSSRSGFRNCVPFTSLLFSGLKHFISLLLWDLRRDRNRPQLCCRRVRKVALQLLRSDLTVHSRSPNTHISMLSSTLMTLLSGLDIRKWYVAPCEICSPSGGNESCCLSTPKGTFSWSASKRQATTWCWTCCYLIWYSSLRQTHSNVFPTTKKTTLHQNWTTGNKRCNWCTLRATFSICFIHSSYYFQHRDTWWCSVEIYIV